MRDTAIVFARAPQLGAVKRRLAHGIGDRAALRFYRANLARLLRSLCRDRRFRTILAITPDRASVRWPGRIAMIPQGRGDIGQRMHRACARFRSVAIVGSDIPDACADDVALAFRAVRHAGAAFGPSVDGGYWLVALGPRRPAKPFADVRWSSEHALIDTLQNFRRTPTVLRTLQDVDTAADLSAVKYRPNAPAGAA